MAKIVLPNVVEYCKKHGYDAKPICFAGEYPLDFGYNKIRYIQECFKIDYDVVWSLDLDTMITNHNQKIEDYLEPHKYFYITNDYNSINAGSFIVRKSEWSDNFLKYCLEQKGKKGMYCEQNAFERYIEENGKDNICFLPHPSINSYLYENYPEIPTQKHEQGQWLEGDFLLHLPGISLPNRLQILSTIKIIK